MLDREIVAWTMLLAGCGRFGFDDTPDDAAPGYTIPAFVQAQGELVGMGLQTAVTLPMPVTAGNMLVIQIDVGDELRDVVSLTDTLGSSVEVILPATDTDDYRSWLYTMRPPTSGDDTVTVRISGNAYLAMRVHELAGSDGVDDAQLFFDGAPTQSLVTTPPVMATTPNAMIFAVVLDGAVTAGPDMTFLLDLDSDVSAYKLGTEPGAYTVSAGTSGSWTAIVAAFRARAR